uniref:Peptidase A1 domain-containing protein n=1 Tax=Bionectria ochroleuca TaxID=29856 RepID=A0A0B7KHD5_BIOOC
MVIPCILLAFFQALSVAVIAAAAAAIPDQSSLGFEGSFSLSVAATSHQSRGFLRDWAAARQKWGKGIPKDVATAFSLLDSNGRVDVQPLGSDDIFIADLEIGNPPQVVKIALDTGSSDLWLQSSDTTYFYNRKGPWAPRYHPNMSRTSNILKDAEWNVKYSERELQAMQLFTSSRVWQTDSSCFASVDGTAANGIVYLDTVRLGGFEISNATIQSALTSVTTDNVTWLGTSRGSDHWDVGLNLMSWEGSNWWLHDFTATVDTGTTLTFLPDVLARMYWSDVPGMRVDPMLSDAFTFPCDGADALPDLRFKLPGTEHVLNIPGPYLNYGPIAGDDTYCWGGMQSADDLESTIIGGTVLKALFVAFDLETKKVGFANKRL